MTERICLNCKYSRPFSDYENTFTCECYYSMAVTCQATDFCGFWEDLKC